MPKVLIDLGPVIDAGPVPELMTAAAAVAPAEVPPSAVLETAPTPAAVIEPVAPPTAPTTPAEDTAGVPDQRLAGVRSAEIDTGAGAVPAPELLATPASGPSIMLDPNLVAEMDAFELANTAATPPPTVTAAPPPKPAAAPAAPAVPGAVVSFVKGGGHPAPVGAPVGGPTLNNAPTVPISPVAAQGSHPVGASKPASAGRTPPPRSPTPIPGDPVAGRRASGEFNALEADFFARESDLYQQEPTESFEDLDPNTREPRRRS
jgi:hypothetical protein